MRDFIRILRDPNPEPAGAAPVVPQTPAPVVPKTKEDWDKLREADPKAWIDLTQPRMDQAIREAREAKEQKAAADAKARNLEAELAGYKNKPAIPVTPEPAGDVPFTRENLPQNDEQWDQLFIEDPKLATDLRVFKVNQDNELRGKQTVAQENFYKARKESAKTIWERHPDMYVCEKDESGNVKLDDKGKPIMKFDPQTGAPTLDLESEKGKLWVDVYSEEQQVFDGAKNGPRLAMLEMERRLQEKGKQQIPAEPPVPSQGQGQAAAPDQRGTMPRGVPPPVSAKVSFRSDEEKAHAERAVQRGVYRTVEEYCSIRDGKDTGITEENRIPQFNR
jgi:hypothetical protein